MTREQIEKAAMLFAGAGEWGECPYNPDAKNGFMAGAEWRINSVWHDGTVSCEARRKALVLFKNGNAAVYKDLRDLSFEQLWGEVDKFAYLDDLLPDTRKEAEP